MILRLKGFFEAAFYLSPHFFRRPAPGTKNKMNAPEKDGKMSPNEQMSTMLMDVATRIRELREIAGLGPEEMAQKTDLSPDMYLRYESGLADLPFTFIHKCAILFGVELTDLLEGSSGARLKSYTVTRKGKGRMTAHEPGIEIRDLAPCSATKSPNPSG
jgi:acetyl-CoA synthetase